MSKTWGCAVSSGSLSSFTTDCVALLLSGDGPWCPQPGHGRGAGEGWAGVPDGWGGGSVRRSLQGEGTHVTAWWVGGVPEGSITVSLRKMKICPLIHLRCVDEMFVWYLRTVLCPHRLITHITVYHNHNSQQLIYYLCQCLTVWSELRK